MQGQMFSIVTINKYKNTEISKEKTPQQTSV